MQSTSMIERDFATYNQVFLLDFDPRHKILGQLPQEFVHMSCGLSKPWAIMWTNSQHRIGLQPPTFG